MARAFFLCISESTPTIWPMLHPNIVQVHIHILDHVNYASPCLVMFKKLHTIFTVDWFWLTMFNIEIWLFLSLIEHIKAYVSMVVWGSCTLFLDQYSPQFQNINKNPPLEDVSDKSWAIISKRHVHRSGGEPEWIYTRGAMSMIGHVLSPCWTLFRFGLDLHCNLLLSFVHFIKGNTNATLRMKLNVVRYIVWINLHMYKH